MLTSSAHLSAVFELFLNEASLRCVCWLTQTEDSSNSSTCPPSSCWLLAAGHRSPMSSSPLLPAQQGLTTLSCVVPGLCSTFCLQASRHSSFSPHLRLQFWKSLGWPETASCSIGRPEHSPNTGPRAGQPVLCHAAVSNLKISPSDTKGHLPCALSWTARPPAQSCLQWGLRSAPATSICSQ